MRYGYGYGLDVKNGFRFFLTQVPGYSADYDKTRGDSVFIDNSNRVMEVNNLQEGLTPTQYHGQKASVLDGTSQYWSKALPTDQAGFNLTSLAHGSTSLPTNWLITGASSIVKTDVVGSAKCLEVTSTASGGVYRSGLLTVGKKYKLKIRYKSNVSIRIGRTGDSTAYYVLPATSEWNTVTRVIEVANNGLILFYASANGVSYIESIELIEDHGLDMNKLQEQILHSKNAEMELSLGNELVTNGTFESTGSWTAESGVTFTVASGIATIVGDGTKGILQNNVVATGSKYLMSIRYKTDASTVRVYAGGSNYVVLPVSTEYKTYETELIAIGSTTIYIIPMATGATVYVDSISFKQIPNLISNGTFTDATNWSLYDNLPVISGGKMRFTADGFTQSRAVTSLTGFAGKRYKIFFRTVDSTLSGNNFRLKGGANYPVNGDTYVDDNGVSLHVAGVHSITTTPNANVLYVDIRLNPSTAGEYVEIDDLHIYEIPEWTAVGNHTPSFTTIQKYDGTGSLMISASGAGRGSELVTNGTFTTGSGWTIESGSPTWSIENSVLNGNGVSGGKSVYTSLSGIAAGDTVEVTLTVNSLTSGYFNVKQGAGAGASTPYTVNRVGTHTFRITAGASYPTTMYFDGYGFVGTVDNVSAKKYQGEISLPSANLESCVATKKYTLEGFVRVDPERLTYGSNLIPSASSTYDTDGTDYWGIRYVSKSWNSTDKCMTLTATSENVVGVLKENIGSGAGLYRLKFKARSATYTGKMLALGYGEVLSNSVTLRSKNPNMTSTWQDYEYYTYSSAGSPIIYTESTTVPVGTVIELDDIIYEKATLTNITFQLGTKSIVRTFSNANAWLKFTYNFEATASEVSKDLQAFLDGAGIAYIDKLSLTQAYDMIRVCRFNMIDDRTTNTDATLIMQGGVGSPTAGGSWSFIRRSTNIYQISLQTHDYNSSMTVQTVGDPSFRNSWVNAIDYFDRTGSGRIFINGVQKGSASMTGMGKIYSTQSTYYFKIGAWTSSDADEFRGHIGHVQIVRFDNISQSNFNPNTYKPGDAITGGGVEIVLWQDWSTVSGGTAYDKYRPETTVRNDLTAYGTPHAGNNVVTIKDYSPQTKKLRQGTQTKQPIYSSVEGFDFDGTDDILEAGASLGSIKTVILKLKADNLELAQDILQLSATAKLTLNTDGTITATGWTSPTVKIQNTLLADSAITANSEYLIAVKSNTAITADAFKLGGSTTFFNGKIRKVVVFTTTLDDPTIQKIFKSIRSM